MTGLIRDAASEHALLLVIDDLHWADRLSLSLLEFIAHHSHESPVCLLGTYRDTDVRPDDPLYLTLGDLERESTFERIALRAMPAAEVRELIVSNTASVLPERTVEQIIRKGEGNPLYLGELLRIVREEGGDALRAPGPTGVRVPEGVRQVIGRRLSGLSAECRAVLSVAAGIGRDFTVSLLSGLEPDLSEEAVLLRLEEACGLGMIRPQGRGLHTFSFAHVLIRETLLAEMPIAQRTRLHARIASALEAEYGERAADHAAEISQHLWSAGTGVERRALFHYLVLAGRQANDVHAYEEALGFLRRATAVPEAEHLGPEYREALFARAQAEAAIGHRDAVRTLRKTFDLFAAAGQEDRAIAVASYPLFEHRGEPCGELSELCRAGLTLVTPHSLEEGQLLAKLALCVASEPANRRAEDVNALLSTALEIARGEECEELELRIVAYQAYLDRDVTSLPVLRRSIEAARRRNDPRAEAFALQAVFRIIYDTRSPIREQRSVAADLRRAAERLGDRQWLSVAVQMEERVALQAGEIDAARDLNDRWLAVEADCIRYRMPMGIVAEPFDSWFEGDTMGNIVDLHRLLIESERGDGDAMSRLVDRIWMQTEQAPAGGLTRIYLAYHLCVIAVSVGNRSWLSIAEQIADEQPDCRSRAPVVAHFRQALLSMLAILHEDREAALARIAEPGGLLTPHGGPSVQPGLLLRTAGKVDAAIEDLRVRRRDYHDRGYGLKELWAAYFLAETLVLRSQPGDVAEADAVLDEILPHARAAGRVSLYNRAGALRRDLSAARHESRPDGLTQREVEVLRLVAAGFSNADIETRLFVSTNTVNTHLHNILQKTGSANRAEAAAYAARRGLLEQ